MCGTILSVYFLWVVVNTSLKTWDPGHLFLFKNTVQHSGKKIFKRFYVTLHQNLQPDLLSG